MKQRSSTSGESLSRRSKKIIVPSHYNMLSDGIILV